MSSRSKPAVQGALEAFGGREPRVRERCEPDLKAIRRRTDAGRIAASLRSSDDLPPIRWDQLEAVMISWASTDQERIMVQHLLGGARSQVDFLPVEETINEILCIASALNGAGDVSRTRFDG